MEYLASPFVCLIVTINIIIIDKVDKIDIIDATNI